MNDTSEQASLLHLPAAALPALHRALSEGRSPTEAAEAARRLGFETGESFLGAFEAWLGDQGLPAADALPADDFWARLGDFFTSLGWGSLEFEALHPGVVSLTSGGWAEAEGRSGARQPACHVTTGLLADLFGRVSGEELAVMEVECRARGDARCRFLLGSRDALEQVYGQLREGRSYHDAIEHLA